MKISQYILKTLESKGENISRLSIALGLKTNWQKLYRRFKRDDFKGYELFEISEVLDIDLEKMRKEIDYKKH